MAVKTVTNANLAEYVQERTELGKVPDAKVEEPKADTPVVATTTETIAEAPDPGVQTPTAKEKKEGKGSFQDRINELTREKKELDEFAQGEYEARLQAQRRIDELESQVKSLTPQPKVEAEAEPDPSKFTDQKEFLKVWGEWNRKEALRVFQAEEAKTRAEEHRKAQEALLSERVQKVSAEIADFAEVIERGAKRNGTNIPNHVKAVVMESEHGPRIAYTLAKDPALEKKIYAMTPALALLELGKIAKSFESQETKEEPAPKPNISKAPAPMAQLKSSDVPVSSDLSQPMDYKEYKRKRQEEQRRARH